MKKTVMSLLCIILILGVFITGCSKSDKMRDNELNSEKTLNKVEEKENVSREEEIDYVLYLRYKDKPFIFDEAYSIRADDERLKEVTIEEFVLNELIHFKEFNEYINPIPEGTKLLSVEKDDKTVIINLSKEFVEGQKGTSNDTMLTLATIINTLTILPGNERVQFIIEGKKVNEINGIDISKPFSYIQGLYPDK